MNRHCATHKKKNAFIHKYIRARPATVTMAQMYPMRVTKSTLQPHKGMNRLQHSGLDACKHAHTYYAICDCVHTPKTAHTHAHQEARCDCPDT
jgi:hypothetical protein